MDTYTDINCYDGIAVISGWRYGLLLKNGYHYDDTYMIKSFRRISYTICHWCCLSIYK